MITPEEFRKYVDELEDKIQDAVEAVFPIGNRPKWAITAVLLAHYEMYFSYLQTVAETFNAADMDIEKKANELEEFSRELLRRAGL